MKPGLYDNDDKLMYTWDELLSLNKINVKNNELISLYIKMSGTLVLSDDICIVNNYAFKVCNISKLVLPESLTKISIEALTDCRKLKHIEVDPKNYYYSSQDGVLFNKNKTKLVKYPVSKEDKEYTIPDSVRFLAMSSFSRNEYLEKINLNKTFDIEEYAFFKTKNLRSITTNGYLYIVGFCAFAYLENIDTITIPKSLKKIEDMIFYNCQIKKLNYEGSIRDLKQIENYELICSTTNLEIENINFNYKLTLEELIKNGKTIHEANKILKNYENSH